MNLFSPFLKVFKIKLNRFLVSCLLVSVLACENKPSTNVFLEAQLTPLEITYATTFELYEHEDFYLLELLQPWPNASETRKVVFVKEGKNLEEIPSTYTHIQLPINQLIVTSTTHIPSLISLNMLDKWVGFPGLDYVSSEEARARINAKKVKEIGKSEGLNTEVILSLQPDLIMGFAVEGSNKSLNNLEKSGIPTLYNSDWLENHPLGKAEWIKVFGILDV